jgi:hypothetical protein
MTQDDPVVGLSRNFSNNARAGATPEKNSWWNEAWPKDQHLGQRVIFLQHLMSPQESGIEGDIFVGDVGSDDRAIKALG